MGICSSSQSRATAPLDSAGRQVRLLMLGTGAAGKSTFLRQLQLLYQDGFSPEERANFRESLRQNALESIQVLIRGVNTMRIPWRTEDAKEAAQRVYEVKPFRDDYFTPNLVQDIKILWKEVAIQLAYKNRSKLQLPEMCEYYLTSIMRIGAANYVPTDEDIVRARIKSTGIAERKIMINKVLFTFIDVGGQRSERRKWVQCFSGGAVTAIFYMASINEYDQFLLEDTRTNRLHEALGVFEALINNAIFRDTAVILFMNKKDLFAEKITRTPLTICFPDYSGLQTYAACCVYIDQQFQACNQNKETRRVYCHVTCATDTRNVEKVFEGCKMTILSANLKRLGLEA